MPTTRVRSASSDMTAGSSASMPMSACSRWARAAATVVGDDEIWLATESAAAVCPAAVCPGELCPAGVCPAGLCPAEMCPAVVFPAAACPAGVCPVGVLGLWPLPRLAPRPRPEPVVEVRAVVMRVMISERMFDCNTQIKKFDRRSWGPRSARGQSAGEIPAARQYGLSPSAGVAPAARQFGERAGPGWVGLIGVAGLLDVVGGWWRERRRWPAGVGRRLCRARCVGLAVSGWPDRSIV